MTVIFAVLGQELLAAEQSVIATDGNGWQLHNLGPSLAQGTSLRGFRLHLRKAPCVTGPKWKPRNCRRLPEPRLATALTQQTLGLLAESKTLNSGVPKALRLSAQSRFRNFSMACVHWLCLSKRSTEEAAAVQYSGPERKPPPCAAEAPCAAKTTMGPCGPRHGLRRPDSCGSCGPCVLIFKVDQRIHSNCWKHLEATCTLGPSTDMTFSGLGSRGGSPDVDAGLKVSSTLALVLFTCNRRWRYSPVCFGRAARSVCASEVPTRRPGPEEQTQLHEPLGRFGPAPAVLRRARHPNAARRAHSGHTAVGNTHSGPNP